MKGIVSTAAAAIFAVFGPSLALASFASAQPVAHFEPGGSAGGGDSHGHNDDGVAQGESEDVDPVQEQDGNKFDEDDDNIEGEADGE